MIEQKYIQTAIDYKKNVAGKFVLVEGAKLKQRIDGQRFAVTRKIDGHMRVVFFVDGNVFMLNASGKERASGLNCPDVFAEAVKAAGLKQAIIAAELYLPREGGRPRCGDVQAALADKRDQLALAPFDIIELDGEAWKAENYADTHNKLCTIFQNEQVKPVQMRNAIASKSRTWATLSDSSLGSITSSALSAKHSRYHETQADDYGYSFLKKCGKNPWAMGLAFKKLKTISKQKDKSMYSKLLDAFSSHPDFDERIERMKSKAIRDGYKCN